VVVAKEEDFESFLRSYPVGLAAEVSPQGMAETLRRLATDEPLRLSLGKAGLEWHRRVLNFEEGFRPVLEELARLSAD
jgi:hypothetical protein